MTTEPVRAPVFDPAVFGGDPDAPAVPMVIGWDELDPAAYRDALHGLSRWLRWFRSTYRVPYTVFPPCWHTHPGILEDLGHLWTGWLLTRHPDAGVGMTGLDWDTRREQAITRLREATAITGCTGTRHQTEPPPTVERPDPVWRDHVEAETRTRAAASAHRAAVDVVTEQLQAAELRHDLAPTILAGTAADPASPTARELGEVADRLHRAAVDAAHHAHQTAVDAVRAIRDQQDHAGREAHLADTRRTLAQTTAAAAINGENPTPPTDAVPDWLTALEGLLPAMMATERAAAAAAARRAAVDRRLATTRRHPDLADLLPGHQTDDQPPGDGHPNPGDPV